jgi:hypothetical protein
LTATPEFYRMRERRDVLVAELSATLDLLWGGQGKEEKRLRKLVGEAIFGVLTQEAWEKMSLEKIERGTRIAAGLSQALPGGWACRIQNWPR